MTVEHVSNISANIQKNQVSLTSSQPEVVADNKESADANKKKMMKYAIGAVALAGAVIGGIYYIKKCRKTDALKKAEDAANELAEKAKKAAKELEDAAKNTTQREAPVDPNPINNVLDETEIIDKEIKIEKNRKYKIPKKKELKNDFGMTADGLKLDSHGNALPKYIDIETMEGERILIDGKLEKIIQKNEKGIVVMELYPSYSANGSRHIFYNDPETGSCIKELFYFDNGKTLHNVRNLENGKPVKFIAYWEDGITIRGTAEYKNGCMINNTSYYEDGKSFQRVDIYAEKDDPAIHMLLKETKYKRAPKGSVRESEEYYESGRGRFIRRDYFADDGITIIRSEP